MKGLTGKLVLFEKLCGMSRFFTRIFKVCTAPVDKCYCSFKSLGQRWYITQKVDPCNWSHQQSKYMSFLYPPSPREDTSLWGKTGIVFGSFWPENSGIGMYSYLIISVIGVYFHLEFSGIGVYCYTKNSGNGRWVKVQQDNYLEQHVLCFRWTDFRYFLCVEKRAQIGASFQWPLGTKILFPSPRKFKSWRQTTVEFGDWESISDQISRIGS